MDYALGRCFLVLSSAALGLACGPVVAVDDASAGASETEPADSTTSTTVTTATTATTTTTTTGTSVDLDGVVDDWDIGPPWDFPEDCMPNGPAGLPGTNLPYLWVASPTAGLLSKVDTETLVIVGEYVTGITQAQPLSTSVSLSGAVAVGNLDGGVTMIEGSLDRCFEGPTSSGPGDALPWGADACLMWHNPLTLSSTRAVAWGPGSFDPVACEWRDEWVWAAGVVMGDQDQAVVVQIEGETGATLAEIPILDVPFEPSGAAVDGEGNLWTAPLGPGSLVRVDARTLAVEAFPMPVPAVGVAVDPIVGTWVCGGEGVAVIDHATQSFTVVGLDVLGGPVEGCASDGEHLWLGGGVWLRGLSLEALALDVELMSFGVTHGIAVDFERRVWAVSDGSLQRFYPRAGAFDPGPSIETTTMSDMTGFQLALVVN